MSAEALSKLSLRDTMVTTRAGAARAQQQSKTTSPSSSQATSPTPSLIESTRQLRYNVSDFDDDLRRRAKRGLMGDNEIRMKYCTTDEEAPAKYIFHLDDDITVAMGGSYTVPRCSCGANEGGRACKHIFWLGDQITSRAPEKLKEQTLELTEDGSTVQDMNPATMLDKLGMEDVAEGLDWVLQEDDVPEEEEEVKDAIVDMLSVFEPNDALPEEFKCPDSPLTSERSRKYQEFADLFTQHAVKNQGLFIQLRDIIDIEFRTHVFFDKVNHRIVRMFKALDQYIANGPTTTSSEALDVTKCATKLKVLVKAINDYHRQQDENGTDTKDIAIRAAAALVNILDGVANRNVNAYENINWGGHGFIPPANPIENNLFVALIGQSNEQDGLFVLDVLQSLPHEVLRSHRETLFNIGEKLTQPWTPPDFVDAFRAITQEGRKRAASAEARGSEAKRAMQE